MISGRLYIHKNKINGKCYVGQTVKRNINARWRDGKGYINSTKFYNAINKYGWENFEHLILPTRYTSIEELDNAEIALIEELDSYNNGYNSTLGGSTGFGQKVSDKTKEKITKNLTGRKVSNETRKKISIANKGHTVSEKTKEAVAIANKKRVHSDETRSKLSRASKGHKMPEHQKELLISINTGSKRSEESKQKMREAWKIRKNKQIDLEADTIENLEDVDKEKKEK